MSEFGYPCVFYADLFGAEYFGESEGKTGRIIIPIVESLPQLMQARQLFAHGKQKNYLDHPGCIALVREGNGNSSGSVTVISNHKTNGKKINVGIDNANCEYVDFLNHRKETVTTDLDGNAIFTVNAESVSIWVKKT